MRRLSTSSGSFQDDLASLSIEEAEQSFDVENVVRAILKDVRNRGDEALLEYTAKFDLHAQERVSELELKSSSLKQYHDSVSAEEREALQRAALRIKQYHQRQIQDSWLFEDDLGNKLGQKITPIQRVGVYVPGGQAAYPSSVLMTVIPARVAGVEEITMVVPTPRGEINALVFAAAFIAGVDRVYTVGGAQAIAALAYGTETISKVDKIVGPGNAYVSEAKRSVFGTVGIDLIAGPSEILIIADGSVQPEWLVMDLFSQAEHAPNAQSLMLCPDEKYLDQINCLVDKMLPKMERRKIIEQSLEQRGALIHTKNLAESIILSNEIAPEHLQLSIQDFDAALDQVTHAGAIFCGAFSAEVLGDYAAGPSHVLPTYGAARYSSPLGVYDFQKRSSVIQCSQTGASNIARVSEVLARGEGLYAHAAAARHRMLVSD